MPAVPTNREEAEAFVRNFHRICDELDPATFDDIYTKDCVLQFGNYPDIEGLDAIKAALGAQFTALDEMHHKLRQSDVVGDIVYQRCTISYVVKGETVTVPAAAVHHIVTEGPEAGLTKRFEVYIHNGPVEQLIAKHADK